MKVYCLDFKVKANLYQCSSAASITKKTLLKLITENYVATFDILPSIS